ncbi:hypothetical protein MRX96_053765 [Rhipicephalus microplus]
MCAAPSVVTSQDGQSNASFESVVRRSSRGCGGDTSQDGRSNATFKSVGCWSSSDGGGDEEDAAASSRLPAVVENDPARLQAQLRSARSDLAFLQTRSISSLSEACTPRSPSCRRLSKVRRFLACILSVPQKRKVCGNT